MSTWTKSSKAQAFGQKGENETVKSFAESLLTGKPVARASRRDTTPKLKPRARRHFGRKSDASEQTANTTAGVRHLGWRFWMVVLLAVSATGFFSLRTLTFL